VITWLLDRSRFCSEIESVGWEKSKYNVNLHRLRLPGLGSAKLQRAMQQLFFDIWLRDWLGTMPHFDSEAVTTHGTFGQIVEGKLFFEWLMATGHSSIS
jgi:hypothetical protein